MASLCLRSLRFNYCDAQAPSTATRVKKYAYATHANDMQNWSDLYQCIVVWTEKPQAY